MKYMKRVFLGYDSEGKRIQKRIYADTKKELSDKEYALKHSDLPSKINFKTYSDKWLRVYKANNSNATRANYERILRLQCLPLHGLPLGAITRPDCQAIINDNADKPPTCKKISTTLNQIFKSAMEDGYIDRNPMTGVSTPRLSKVTRRALTKAEKERIATAKLSDMDRLYLDTLLYLGVRPGEAAALKAEDFGSDSVTISRAMEFPHNQPIEKSTKTGNVRSLPLPNAYKPKLPKSGYIFNHNGSPLSKQAFRRMFERIKKAIGDDDLHPYVFRYNYATNLYYSGITIKKASYLMGHSDTNMILKIYAQIDEERESISALKNMDFTV